MQIKVRDSRSMQEFNIRLDEKIIPTLSVDCWLMFYENIYSNRCSVLVRIEDGEFSD